MAKKKMILVIALQNFLENGNVFTRGAKGYLEEGRAKVLERMGLLSILPRDEEKDSTRGSAEVKKSLDAPPANKAVQEAPKK